MGCDIHFYTEKQVGANWVSADKWSNDKYAEKGEIPGKVVDYSDSYYNDRNYSLFAILANVRNGRGFAGCDTGDGYNPIDDPRGLPDDVNEAIKKESDDFGIDGHSHSWFTLKELLEYDWTQISKCRGYVGAETFRKWMVYDKKYTGSPDSYCGDISGERIKKISVEEMEKKYKELGGGFVKTLKDYYCQLEWEETYYHSTSHFWSHTIPQLLRLGKPENVRIVFWFDN